MKWAQVLLTLRDSQPAIQCAWGRALRGIYVNSFLLGGSALLTHKERTGLCVRGCLLARAC